MTAPLIVDALVPVKGFVEAKERLSGLLTPTERAALARAMFVDVLTALRATAVLRHVYVVSADAEALALASACGGRPIAEPPESAGLNGGLQAALGNMLAAPDPPDGLLVVPADIPGIDPAGVASFLGGVSAGRLVRVCPSPDGGTNALLTVPPDAIAFAFGPASATRHRERARVAGVPFELRSESTLLLDLDNPDDVARCVAAGRGKATIVLLSSMRLAGRIATVKPGAD